MELKSFDTILTQMCDDFDDLITPKRIARTNTNIVYLMFKAIAKGHEVINNVCVVLSNKFNPEKCLDEDLISVASLVGTERLSGSASGLEIIITNDSESSVTLISGFYTYSLNDDTKFVFELLEDLTLEAGGSTSYIAMSNHIGEYPVTAQADIEVTTPTGVPDGVKFSCADNSSLLGTPAETTLAFRERILTDTTRQDSIKELELKLKNLPYLYDAKVLFNNTVTDQQYSGYTLPPFTMLIFFSGSPRNEIAEVVASNNIYPTLHVEDDVKVSYLNDIFVNGSYDVYIKEFARMEYSLVVNYKLDITYTTQEKARAEISNFLYLNFRGHIHSDYVKEEDIYNKLKEFNVAGIEILNVDIKYNGESVPYIEVPVSAIPYLANVTPVEA